MTLPGRIPGKVLEYPIWATVNGMGVRRYPYSLHSNPATKANIAKCARSKKNNESSVHKIALLLIGLNVNEKG